jgi:tRNA threonylcarbamoyladenosine biosynthesis protein TsaE
MTVIYSLEEINAIAKQILATPSLKKIITFHAQMGAGKTTLIKELVKELGVKDNSSSPTFSLVNEYKITSNEFVYHFDVYRLKNESEALDFGIDDYLYSGNWCFIEWADKIPNLLPDAYSEVFISILPDGKRKVVLQ